MKRLFLFPFLCFFLAFFVDKLLYIGDFDHYFLRTATPMNYEQKIDLLDELEDYTKSNPDKKTIVMFGNSRTMSFDKDYIEQRHPGWTLFNFSVPGGTADYYKYEMEKLAARNIKPAVIFFAVSPQGFNATPVIAMDETMVTGVSFEFVLRHLNYYKPDEVSNYVAKKLFWNYQFRPKLDVILARAKNNSQAVRDFRRFTAYSLTFMTKNQGSIPFMTDARESDDEEYLENTALGAWKTFLVPYKISTAQVRFTEDSLKISEDLGVPAVLLWAKVGKKLRELKSTEIVGKDENGNGVTIKQLWMPIMDRLSKQYHAPIVDMNYGQTIKCDRFYDASHMSGVCFPEFSDFLIQTAESVRTQPGL